MLKCTSFLKNLPEQGNELHPDYKEYLSNKFDSHISHWLIQELWTRHG
jgi:hypothetical protein